MLDLLYAKHVSEFYIKALSRELQDPEFIHLHVVKNLMLDVMFTIDLEQNMQTDSNKFVQYINTITDEQPTDLTSHFHDFLKLKYQQWRES